MDATKSRDEEMHESGHFMLKVCMWILVALFGLVAAYVGWSGTRLYELPALSQKIDDYAEDVKELKQEFRVAIQNQYSKDQAANDKKLIDLEFRIIHKRIDSLEGK